MFNKQHYLITVLLLLMLIVSACGNASTNQSTNTAPDATSSDDTNQSATTSPPAEENASTITYQSENGPIEIPANPTRIVALASAPNVISLGGTVVGVDEWTMGNPLFTDKLDGVTVVSEANPESIMDLNPDLIIAGAHMSNLEQLEKIAPTVVYTWGKLDYLEQQIEIGKLLNKEEEAKAWADSFKQRTEAIGKEIKAKYGDNVSVSVFEVDAQNNFYVFGNNWARGTEILYQAMGLAMPEKVEQDALGPGYYTLSQEVLPEYAGDFIVLSLGLSPNNEFLNSEVWNNIPAVKNKQIIEIDTRASSYSDPITLDYLTTIFEEGFLGKKK